MPDTQRTIAVPLDAPQIGTADVVVLLACGDTDGVRTSAGRVAEGIDSAAPGMRVLIVCPDAPPAEQVPDGDHPRLTLTAAAFTALDRIPATTPGGADAYATLFTIANQTGARAALMIGSAPDAVTAALVRTLAEPIMTGSCHVVAPRYARQKYDGLIDSAIVSPFARALYGKRIRGHIGLDFGFSAQVAQRWGGLGTAGGGEPRLQKTAWILPQALSDNLSVGQANLPVRLPPVAGPQDVTAVLGRVTGSFFADIERHAPFWQRVTRSLPVPTFGAAPPLEADDGAWSDVLPLIESFRLAYRNLHEIWGLVLPPATLLELKRLTALPVGDFRMSDQLWARIVYDFALAHRLRTINRDHLLGALTPAYLAWVASYALEIRDAPARLVEERIERLCLAYEGEKPYLLRRWRWPDRFNP